MKKLHQKYLKEKGKFKITCSHEIFSYEEIILIEKYGYWFKGLINGDIDPYTEKQKNFVNVFKNNLTPKSEEEKIWYKYQGRMKLEKENPEKFNLNFTYIEDSFYTRDDYYKLHPEKKKMRI